MPSEQESELKTRQAGKVKDLYGLIPRNVYICYSPCLSIPNFFLFPGRIVLIILFKRFSVLYDISWLKVNN